MRGMEMEELHSFIVEAKAAAYVGGRAAGPSSRRGSHDIAHQRGSWEASGAIIQRFVL